MVYKNTGDDIKNSLVLKKTPKDYIFLFKKFGPSLENYRLSASFSYGSWRCYFQNETTHTDYMSEYMEQAVKRKIPLIFLSCGVQSQKNRSLEKYLDYAEFITVMF